MLTNILSSRSSKTKEQGQRGSNDNKDTVKILHVLQAFAELIYNLVFHLQSESLVNRNVIQKRSQGIISF